MLIGSAKKYRTGRVNGTKRLIGHNFMKKHANTFCL